MDLFEHFRITTECVLCGCKVNNSDQLTTNESGIFSSSNSKIICQYCHVKMPLSQSSCFTCGLPLFSKLDSADQAASIGNNCGNCLANSPNYDRTVSAFHYEYPINNFISQLKYGAQLQYLPILADYLLSVIRQHYLVTDYPSLIIPVPLHRAKLADRGFNQSRLLANKLSNPLSIKVLNKGIRRIKSTQAQSGLDSNERRVNMKNAFQIDSQLPAHVAVVDDVVTTGMTVSELTKQAKLAGAQRVDIWCLARAFDY
jgi:ComF family protein